MRWIFGLIGAVIGSALGEEVGLLAGAAFGFAVGWIVERERSRNGSGALAAAGAPQNFEQRATARIIELLKRVDQLEKSVAELKAQMAPSASAEAIAPRVVPPPVTPLVLDDRGVPIEPPDAAAARDAAIREAGSLREWAEQQEEQAARERANASPVAVLAVSAAASDAFRNERDRREAAAAPAIPQSAKSVGPSFEDAIRTFFFGGNTVVRIGILILTIGVGLLVKYAADQSYFPLELRLAFAAAIGLALVVVGYRQRKSKPAFGTALQGGGVAAMYLVTFFSYYAYHLLPAPLTLALLIALAVFSSVLAVVQNAQQLAVFGAIGGFLSPVLASTGEGSHVALFSYYALLNVAIVAIAIFRSWRILNWTGFAFTFGIASAWGALRYESSNVLSATGFLALFFLMYVVDGTLFAIKRTGADRGTIDTTLTFGTPLATLALAGGMFAEQPLFMALACVFIASVYIGFARALFSAGDAAMLPLSRAYVAVGIGVATLAVPFALDDTQGTALAWAAEAAGLMWVGLKQERLRTRVGSYVLFGGSIVSLFANEGHGAPLTRSLFYVLIASAMLLAAALLERARSRVRALEPYLGHALFGVGIVVWIAAGVAFSEGALPSWLQPFGFLVAVALSTVLFESLGARYAFGGARTAAQNALPFLLLYAVGALFDSDLPFGSFGVPGFALAIGAALWALKRSEDALAGTKRADVALACGVFLVSVLTSHQAHAWSSKLELASGWVAGMQLFAPLLIVALAVRQRPAWPFVEHARGTLLWSSWPLVFFVALASLVRQADCDGAVSPLPYLPILNPLDLSQATLAVLTALLARTAPVRTPTRERIGYALAGIVTFVGLNATVVRTAHHWAGVPFTPWDVPTAPVVQSAISILWTTLALIAMVIAHRRRVRAVWILGAVLLGAVVLKLFFVDLSNLSNVAKIITFLAVGVLLLLIGYFAPVPPADERTAVLEPVQPKSPSP